MFGWLLPSSCPLDPEAKRWVESRLLWLRDEFGADDLYAGSMVLPTPEFFPDKFDGSRAAVRVLFDRVCEYMGVEPGLIRLKFLRPTANPLYLTTDGGEAVPTEAAGLYEGDVIRVNEGQTGDPMGLVGTLAHELAHQRLLGEGRIDPGVYDNELLTDLTVVFKGLGVFRANTELYHPGTDTRWPGSALRKPEYMTGPMFGYAFALLAWVRGDDTPRWARHLRSAVRAEFRQGLRFLHKTGDAALRRPARRPR